MINDAGMKFVNNDDNEKMKEAVQAFIIWAIYPPLLHLPLSIDLKHTIYPFFHVNTHSHIKMKLFIKYMRVHVRIR